MSRRTRRDRARRQEPPVCGIAAPARLTDTHSARTVRCCQLRLRPREASPVRRWPHAHRLCRHGSLSRTERLSLRAWRGRRHRADTRAASLRYDTTITPSRRAAPASRSSSVTISSVAGRRSHPSSAAPLNLSDRRGARRARTGPLRRLGALAAVSRSAPHAESRHALAEPVPIGPDGRGVRRPRLTHGRSRARGGPRIGSYP